MNKYLPQIISDTERALKYDPQGKRYPLLESITDKDERFLSEYLLQQRKNSPLTRRYENYPLLVSEEKKLKKPLKELKNLRNQYPKLEKDVKNLESKISSLEWDIPNDATLLLGTLPERIYKMIDFIELEYGAIIANGKALALEKDMDPISLAKIREGRNEITKRIYPTREQFEWMSDAKSEFSIIALGLLYKLKINVEPELDKIERSLPLVGRLFTRKARNRLNEVPPKAVIEAYIRDSREYSKEKADEIYPTMAYEDSLEL